jgi:hypothetical protein
LTVTFGFGSGLAATKILTGSFQNKIVARSFLTRISRINTNRKIPKGFHQSARRWPIENRTTPGQRTKWRQPWKGWIGSRQMIKPFQGCKILRWWPSVAATRQRWAEGLNPVEIQKCRAKGAKAAKDFLWTKFLTTAKSIYEWALDYAALNSKTLWEKKTSRRTLQNLKSA